MPIAFDNAFSGGSAGNASSLTYSHTVGAGLTNSILVIGVGYFGGGVASITGITYAGVACTKMNRYYDGTHANAIELWYVLAPVAGANNVIITMSAGVGAGNAIQAISSAFSGVDQTAIWESANATNTTQAAGGSSISNTITVSNRNGWVIDLGESDHGTAPVITANVGQTQPSASPKAGGGFQSYVWSSYKGPVSTATTTLGWSWTVVTDAFVQYAQVTLIPATIKVSKLVAYAVLAINPGADVTKLVGYAVLGNPATLSGGAYTWVM